MTLAQAKVLSEALSQYLENANDSEEQSAEEASKIKLAEQMLAEIDTVWVTHLITPQCL